MQPRYENDYRRRTWEARSTAPIFGVSHIEDTHTHTQENRLMNYACTVIIFVTLDRSGYNQFRAVTW